MPNPSKTSRSGARAGKPVPAWSVAYRPASYFGDHDLEARLQTRVKGQRRRELLRSALEAGEIAQVPAALLSDGLGDGLRQAIGGLHPSFMGGEYLPTAGEAEVEIARIRIASTTSDVTSVYARPLGRRIAYRVVDEYDGDTLSGNGERTSLKPLTMGVLLDFFLGAWDLYACLECNFEDDLEGMLGFFSADSAFYPYLGRALHDRVLARFAHLAQAGDEDEDSDADED